ncbi:methionyl-tRNA formyltransferase [Candidatus Peregrinibacteria bacterium]|nr:methionyl-tRNA formyltransferase [Candidatus Peregrinibacteria bacterium]
MPSKQKTTVWFLGTSSFAVPSLEAFFADSSFYIDLVITQPDRQAGRKREIIPSPVKITAEKHGVKILQPANINSHFHDSRNPAPLPDYLAVVSYGQILSQEILDIPRIAPVNLHASLLPRWRGASPMQHALLAGDSETGVTVQIMAKELDAGPILAQEKVAIESRETFETLHNKLAAIGARLLIATLKSPLNPIGQDQSRATICRTFQRANGFADPISMTAEEIDRKARALNPWPGVTVVLNGQSVKLLATSLEPANDSAPLACANGTVLRLVAVQPAGGKAMTGGAWARGR